MSVDFLRVSASLVSKDKKVNSIKFRAISDLREDAQSHFTDFQLQEGLGLLSYSEHVSEMKRSKDARCVIRLNCEECAYVDTFIEQLRQIAGEEIYV